MNMKKIIALCTISLTLLTTASLHSMLIRIYSMKKALYTRNCHANHHPYPPREMFELHEENCILERQNKELLTLQQNNREALLICHHKNRLLNEHNKQLIEIIR